MTRKPQSGGDDVLTKANPPGLKGYRGLTATAATAGAAAETLLLRNLLYLLQESGKSDRWLATIAGLNPGFLNDLKRKGGNPSQRTLTKLAQALGLTVTDLIEKDLQATRNAIMHGSQAPSAEDLAILTATRKLASDADVARPVEMERGHHDLPVFGAFQAGLEGAEIDYHYPVDYIERPPNLRNVVRACGCYVVNDSMEPRYEQGTMVHVHPGLPVRSGDYVVVELTEHRGLVKRFLRKNDKHVVVSQLNPAREITLAAQDVVGIYRIVGTSTT